MALDVETIAAVKEELCGCVSGLRIDKVQQPGRYIIILTLAGKARAAQKLLISADAGSARVHLSEHKFENPASPPMFCMLLRKHLTGARIDGITQPHSERMLEFTLKTSPALGDTHTLRLAVELFGSMPNIILIGSDGIIIDCLRRISGDMKGRRMVLPGLRYVYPRPADTQAPPAGAGASGAAPVISISKALDALYTIKSKEDDVRQCGAALTKNVKSLQKRIVRRLAAQREELAATAGRDYLRECGDLIMANLHLIKKGDEVIAADDFYTPGNGKREIKLDPLLTAQKNAAKYYKAYKKARNAVEHLNKQIAVGEAELEYIESVLQHLLSAEAKQELDDIREELAQAGYHKLKTKPGSKTKRAESKPALFKSSAGMLIYAGKNNTQNERLTMKTASKSDIWLHTQKIHGAHVIIVTEGKSVCETTLREAAAIAAFYSAARGAGKVPVDYTLVKNVRKPPGERPGRVTYSDFKTIIAEPDENLVMQLKV